MLEEIPVKDKINQFTEPREKKNKFSRRQFLKFAGSGIALSALGGYFYWPHRWQYIVVHHSAGNYGNIEFLQKVHRQRQAGDPIDAIPYHYVIGNGNGMKLGEVASDWRKENNLWGAHVSGNNSARNFFGLGICMIGNYDQRPVPAEQFQSLVNLCKQLCNEFSIPAKNINGHGLIDGERTLCPGKNLSIEKLRRSVTA